MSADKEALSVYVVRHGIVLIDALKRWVDQTPNLSAAELLVARSAFIQERTWWEQFGSDAGMPRHWPSGAPSSLPEETFNGPGRLLLKSHPAVLLQWKPFPILGVIDPFNEGALRAWCQKHLPQTPGVQLEVRTVSPHFIDACRAHLQGLPDPDKGPVPPPLPRPSRVDVAAWAALCEMNPEGVSTWQDLAGTIAESFLMDTLPPDFLVSAVPIEGIEEAMVVQRSDTVAWLVTAHAHDRRIVDSALQHLGMRVIPFAIPPEDFRRLKETFVPQIVVESDVRATSAWDIDPQLDPDLAGIELYRKLMGAAVRAGASDIHLDPKERRVRVRFRIHGELTEQAPLNLHLHQILLRRLKMQAGMRHDVKGAIQDGSGEFETDEGEVTEQRYSIAVVKGGAEAVVIRLLSRKLPKLEDVHLDAASRRAIDWFLEGDGGMFVITGPTGSGKTTTLYACLSKVDVPELKIITVEHPVEKHLPGAVQIDVREDGEITFKAALKAVVRQDPVHPHDR
ncbi:MAG: ATPase, T2SS/T4P/T4SS family [Verrucomicrobium sp.]|nr:ATPase, T2SS/T4P/T4SS family [Verrucomicrobium sp.]